MEPTETSKDSKTKKTIRIKKGGKVNRINLNERDQILALEIFRSDSFLTVNKNMLMQFGPNLSIFLENLVDKYAYFKARNMLQEDGSFFLTHEDQCNQTGLGEHQIRSNKKKLIEKGILKTKMRGVPAKEFYFVDLGKLLEVFIQELSGDKNKQNEFLQKMEKSSSEKLRKSVKIFQKIEECMDYPLGTNSIPTKIGGLKRPDLRKSEDSNLRKSEESDLRKSEESDLRKSEEYIRRTNNNNNKEKENIYLSPSLNFSAKHIAYSNKNSSGILSETAKAESVEITDKKNKAAIKERNKQYVPFAIQLAEIVQTNKNIKITQAKIRFWSDSIRQLSEIEGVHPKRIQTALDWYENNIGSKYVPIIECGHSFRKKFIGLEEAIKRQDNSVELNSSRPVKLKPDSSYSAELNSSRPARRNINSGTASLPTAPTGSVPPGPKAIIRQRIEPELAAIFESDCYQPAKELLPNLRDKADRVELVNVLIDRYERIISNWNRLPPEDKTISAFGPMTVLERYIEWLGDQDWITDKRISMFNQSKLFDRFYSEYIWNVKG